MPVTIGQFLERLEASEILDEGALEAVRAKAGSPEEDAEEFVKHLHRDGDLTGYQAKVLWKDKGNGLSLGNYVVEDELGRGGMGVVLQARHRRMQRCVAIKVLPAKFIEDADAIARFQREVVAASQLEHQHIVTAYDADEVDGQHILVMQFVDGKDLSSIVKKKGPLSVEQAIDCVQQAARGLEYAHGKGVVHRDIKPANLLLDSEGTVKILDMGLARFSESAEVGEQAELTGTGTIMGTVDYMSPEQAMSTRAADERSDVYSLGCTLWYLLTAKPTFTGESLMARMMAHANKPIPNLVDVRNDVPDALQSVFERMVAKKPDERMQSMTEVVTALEACRGTATGTVLTAAAGDSSHSGKNLSGFLKSVDADEVSDDLSPSRAKAATATAAPAEEPEVDVDSQTIVATPTSGTIKTQSEQSSTQPIVRGLPRWLTDWRVLAGAGGLVALVVAVAMSIGGGDDREGVVDTTSPAVDPAGTIDTEQTDGPFALEFDGVDDYVDIPTLVPPKGPVTVEAWAVVDRDKSNMLVSCSGQHHFLDLWCGGVDGFTRKEAGQSGTSKVAAAVRGRLVHYAGVWNGKDLQFFVDGRASDQAPRDPHSGSRELVGTRFGQLDFVNDGDAQSLALGGSLRAVRISSAARYSQNFVPAKSWRPDDDTLALYHFDEGEGDVLKDSSGNGHHGKIVGAKWVEVEQGIAQPVQRARYALKFDDSSDTVELPNLVNDGGPYTIEARLSIDEVPAANGGYVLAFRGATTRSKLQLTNTGLGHLRLVDGRLRMAEFGNPRVGVDYHVAATWDGAIGRLFVDGQPIETGWDSVQAGEVQPARSWLGAAWIEGELRVPSFLGTLGEVRISTTVRYTEVFEPPPRHEPDKHTLALYHCDEGQGDVLKDSSGNGHHGKIVGAKWVRVDEPRHALRFDGMDDFVELPTMRLDELPAFTVETSIRNPSLRVLGIGSAGDPENGMGLFVPPGFLTASFESGPGTDHLVKGDFQPSPDTWYHVALVFEKGRSRLLVDGRMIAEANVEFGPISPQAPFRLWSLRGSTKNEPGSGEMRAFRVSSVARYGEGTVPTEPWKSDEHTLALYHFDEGQGDVLKDSSGNGHHGKIEGAKWVRVDDAANRHANVPGRITGAKFVRVVGNGNIAHDGRVRLVAVSPDGRRVASANDTPDENGEHQLKIWEVASGGLSLTAGVESPVHLAFTPDGRFLVVTGKGGEFRVFDAESSLPTHSLILDPPLESTFALSPDKNSVALFPREARTAKYELRDLRRGNVRSTPAFAGVAGQDRGVHSAAYAPDGKSIAIGIVGTGHAVQVLDAESGRVERTFPTTADPSCVAYSFDGTALAWVTGEKLQVWNPATDGLTTLDGPKAVQHFAAFDPLGRTVQSFGSDGRLLQWNVATGERMAAIQVPPGGATAGGFDNSGRLLATGHEDGSVAVYEVSRVPADERRAAEFGLRFDGEDRVEIPNLRYDGTHPITVEAEILVDEYPAETADQFVVLSDTRGRGLLLSAREHSRIDFGVDDGRTMYHAIGSLHRRGDPDNAMLRSIHVCGTFDGEIVSLYVNGRSVDASRKLPFEVIPFEGRAEPWWIGGAPRIAGSGFRGEIRRLRISKSVRYGNDYEPPARYEADSETMALYHLDEGEGNILVDSSGHGHHGRIVGAEWVRVDAESASVADLMRSGDWEWTEPENLGATVNSDGRDAAPTVSANGRVLVFNSNRPTRAGKTETARAWFTTRESLDAPWAEPQPLPTEAFLYANQPEWSADGRSLVYFRHSVEKPEHMELYEARRDSIEVRFSRGTPIATVNSPGEERSATLTADGLRLVFLSKRDGGLRLYSSRRPDLGAPFEAPVPVPFVEETGELIDAALANDGLTLFVIRKEKWRVAVTSRRSLDAPFGPLLDLPLQGVHHIDAAPDGLTLYFSSFHPGGHGEEDLSVTRLVRRSPPPANAPFDAAAAKAHQKATAKHLGEPVVTTNSIGMQLAVIPPGEFKMGEGENIVDVTLTKPFRMGVHEVTQRQWKAVMGTEPWKGQEEVIEGDKVPVTNVTWADAVAFCRRLTEQAKEADSLRVDWEYRLPMEAEWEFACRAGTTTRYSFGEDESQLDEFGWHTSNTRDAAEVYAHAVGSKKANAWGMHDIHGNVWEWCSDLYDEVLPGGTDPNGPTEGTYRVRRGGGHGMSASGCRSASRYKADPQFRNSGTGFRVVLGPTLKSTNTPPPAKAPFDDAAAKRHQEAWAKHLGEPVVTTNSIGMELAVIPPGEFEMGEGENVVEVTLTKPFRFGVHEVTQGQWKAVIGTEPWVGQRDIVENDDVPVEFVEWAEAVEFCRVLTERERTAGRLGDDMAYRLPTEAEWEWACRAGTASAYSFGDDETRLDEYAWFDANTKKAGRVHAQLVGLKRPNAWGLYDVHGNVYEWCSGWYDTDADDARPPRHVFRGGSWNDVPQGVTSTTRLGNRLSYRDVVLGFRVVLGPVSSTADYGWQNLLADNDLATMDVLGDVLWSVEDGVLRSASTTEETGGGALVTKATFTDYELDFEMRLPEGGSVTPIVDKHGDGTQVNIAPINPLPADKEWHRVRVTEWNNRLAITVDRQPSGQHSYAGDNGGRVGFRAYDVPVEYRNVRIRALAPRGE